MHYVKKLAARLSGLAAEAWLKGGLVVFLIGGALLVHWYNPALYATLWYLLTSGDIQALADVLRAYGLWAIIISILFNIAINMLGFLPSIFISAANGVVFGLIPGIFISWLAECLGAIISFVLIRRFFRHTAERLIVKSKYLGKLDEFSGANGFTMMLAARSLPVLPAGLITAAGAVSRIRFRDHALATLLGKFPATALEVMVGYDLVNYEQNLLRLSVVIGLAFLIYYRVWWRRRQRQQSPTEER